MAIKHHEAAPLMAQLQQHESLFSTIFSHIPPTAYNGEEVDAADTTNRFAKHVKKVQPKQEKQFKLKLTRSQVTPTKKAKNDEDDTSVADIMTPVSLDSGSQTDEGDASAIQPLASGGADELRSRLKDRIAQLQTGRQSHTSDKADFKARQAIRENRLKRKRAERAQAARDKVTANRQPPQSLSALQLPEGDASGKGKAATKASGKAPKRAKTVKENMSFGALDFSAADEVSPSVEQSHGRVKDLGKRAKTAKVDETGGSAAVQLARAEAKQAKLAALAEANPEQYQTALVEDAWNRALHQAEGQKVRDDVGLLKKAVRREESRKRKSASTWDDRKRNVSDSIQKRQQTRNDNLQARIDAKKDRKRGIKPTKTSKKKQRPGFEGGAAKFGKSKDKTRSK
ncbi:hypothetical protein IWQ60_006398 [Tieghemiomyces parasiticus]|uniref:Ribosomal RNA-processing protein 14/surfeit locus protein 6 C-terminal domain-containing protein n=1 Tax=Tieghemiomyces parasiticus TaxID=78921 RepID=A0A9W8DXM6_9FUNG|nr:hypothetical protein IWQ60_006398 [Tieghemiomyces parasiticus]